MAEALKRINVTREMMLQRLARFAELKGSDGGLPDSNMPAHMRTLFNVIGFQPPEADSEAVTSPVGDNAARLAAIKINEGFNLGFCKAYPGKGPMMHNHDTNETFIAITGRWRCSWENEKGEVDFIDIDPLDVCSFPAGAPRRFENVTEGDPNVESILMFVISGNAPKAEFTDKAMAEIKAAGVSSSK
ncbi:cupin domain-containing protein [Paraburkholderia sp. 22B1P]|uniref:cupin domain-containing protein n=1 Tax=Paraburkholderia sp. 22B1P TaxID=3080498 RepID=UPI003087E8AC|nr:cupin domain-containing protein [Paraburkholderia sp. 22B1P]